MDKRATDVALRPRLGVPLVDSRRRVPSLVPSVEPCAQFHAPRPFARFTEPAAPAATVAIMHRHCSCAAGLAKSRSRPWGSLSRECVDTAGARTCLEQRMTRCSCRSRVTCDFVSSTALGAVGLLILRPVTASGPRWRTRSSRWCGYAPLVPPPNILLIMTDEERYPPPDESDVVKEFRRQQLPARESIRDGGLEFHHHYTGSTACVPSRATLFTGQFPLLHGVSQTDGIAKRWTDPAMGWLDPDQVPTLGDWFRAGGVISNPLSGQMAHHSRRPADPRCTREPHGVGRRRHRHR